MAPRKYTLKTKDREMSNEDLMIEEHENQQEEIRNSGVSPWVADVVKPISRVIDWEENAIDPDLMF
jgi:hypothetical protein